MRICMRHTDFAFRALSWVAKWKITRWFSLQDFSADVFQDGSFRDDALGIYMTSVLAFAI